MLIFAFVALAARAVMFATSDDPWVLLAVQCSDAFSTGVFGVLGVLIVSDLTRNTGRFNAAQGAVATVQGIGAFLSNAMAGYLADTAGKGPAFLTLAGVAVAGLAVACFVPETRDKAEHAAPRTA